VGARVQFRVPSDYRCTPGVYAPAPRRDRVRDGQCSGLRGIWIRSRVESYASLTDSVRRARTACS